MTWVARASDVGHVALIAGMYKGGGAWDGFWATWQTLWPWSDSPWNSARPTASFGTMVRRRSPSELLRWAGRQKRRRRTVLAGWDRAARLRAQQRGRERAR